MEKYYEALKRCPLFVGMEKQELFVLLDCLSVRRTAVSRGDTVIREGDPAESVGIVLSGRVQIIRHDYSGKRSILGDAGPSELFAEVFACAGVASLPVSAVAVSDSEILLADFRRIIDVCSSACRFHTELIRRLLRIVAEKNLLLNRKRLMVYLSLQAEKSGSREFTIPYDRQGLADYLGVERSAMSAEISSLRKEGVIECVKNRFRLL